MTILWIVTQNFWGWKYNFIKKQTIMQAGYKYDTQLGHSMYAKTKDLLVLEIIHIRKSRQLFLRVSTNHNYLGQI